MAKKRRKATKEEKIGVTPERALKGDIFITNTGATKARSVAEKLHARDAITTQQLDAWNKLEELGQDADYGGQPKTVQYDSAGGGTEACETAKYINARQTLARLSGVLGLKGYSVVESVVIMGEPIKAYAFRSHWRNERKVMGALLVALDVAASFLQIGDRERKYGT